MIALFSSCAVFKRNRTASYKWSVATVVAPKAKSHSERLSKKTPHHFSTVTFPADSMGKKITVKGDYDATHNTFIYFHAKAGDKFLVHYDSLNPRRYTIYSSKPWIDPQTSDTTLGRITKVFAADGYVEYTYRPDSTKSNRPLLHKIQDVRSDSLADTRRDLKKDSLCPVIFNRLDPSKSYLFIGDQVGLIAYERPGTHQIQRKNARPAQHHRAYSVGRGSSSLYAFASINLIPAESLRLGFSLLLFERISAGFEASLLYKDQLAQRGQTTGKDQFGKILKYPENYFSLDKNAFIYNVYVKCYLFHQKDRPGAGVYVRGGYTFTSTFAGVKSDYYNRPDIPLDTMAASFIKMDPLNHKVLTAASSFKTNGFTLSLGGSFYLAGSRHWLMDIGLGYNYLKLPSAVSQNRIANNETFYYHISPIWRNPIAIPLFAQLSVMYKF